MAYHGMPESEADLPYLFAKLKHSDVQEPWILCTILLKYNLE